MKYVLDSSVALKWVLPEALWGADRVAGILTGRRLARLNGHSFSR